MKCMFVVILLVATVSAKAFRERRTADVGASGGASAGAGASAGGSLPGLPSLPNLPTGGGALTGGSASCTADQKAACGMAQCQNNGNSNTQVIGGGNSGGGGLISGVPINALNGAGVQVPINANICPPVSVCNLCLAGNVLG
ncbi:loricrin-like [Paramacrobiotus metropolitanus]|uniref:loricrin-like n=1 Tax=Paramacrobiotus metropolitanus TaxID=2943436 RepID=UPI00244630F6|nr:loricrin-like [Paramacrobiotus metropolitanus]